MTGISNTYSSVLRNVGNIITIILSLITTQLKTIAGVKTFKHQSTPRKRSENIGNVGRGLKKRRWRHHIDYHLLRLKFRFYHMTDTNTSPVTVVSIKL